MCGIAGFSLDRDSGVDRTLAAQALLAGIAERGADAVGYAYRSREPQVSIHKQRSGATALLDAVSLPCDAAEALVHVRDYTKGHPTLLANNHPIRHGSVVGIHNGIIVNDEAILRTARHRARGAGHDRRLRGDLRAHAQDTLRPQRARGAARLDGDGLDRRARGGKRSTSPAACARPLWIGRARREVFFASTKAALEIVEGSLRPDPAQAGGRRGPLAAPRAAAGSRPRSASAVTAVPRREAAPRRSRAARAGLVPREAGPAERLGGVSRSQAQSEPSGRTVTPSSRSRSRTRNWKAAHGAGRRCRRAGRPATPTAGPDRRAGRPSSRPSAADGRASRASTAPCATARSSLSSPIGTSKPASRSAALSEPNVCQMSDFDAMRRRFASRSRAVGVRPSSSPSRRSCSSSSSRLMNRRGVSPAARLAAFHVPKCSITVWGCTSASGSAANSRIVGERPRRSALARSCSRICSSV